MMSAGLSTAILLLVPGAPLAAAGLLWLMPGRRWMLRLAAAPGLLVALLWPALWPAGTAGTVDAPWLLEGTVLELDFLGRTALLTFSAIWLLASWDLARGRGSFAARRLSTFFLLAMAGNLGTAIAADMASFYAAFSLTGLAGYGLVVHRGTPQALRAGRVYIAVVLIGEVLVFSALAALWREAGTTQFPTAALTGAALPAALLLAFFGFGSKAGAFGLHVPLPLAYEAAPPPAAMALAAAMLEAGLLGWARFLPPGAAAGGMTADILIWLGLGTAYYGVAVGIGQRGPKALLAYSSISQMGLATVALGLGLSTPAVASAVLAAVTLFALHHGLAKAALFWCADAAEAGPQRRRWATALALLPSLALAGAPLTAGAAFKKTLHEMGKTAEAGATLELLLTLSAAGTMLLLIRFLFLLAVRTASDKTRPPPVLWPLLPPLALALPWIWLPEQMRGTLSLSALWPILGAAAVALAAHRLASVLGSRWYVPAGDILVPAALAWQRLRKAHDRSVDWLAARAAAVAAAIGALSFPWATAPSRYGLTLGGSAFLVLLLLFALWLASA